MPNAKLKCNSCGDRFPRDQMKRVNGVTNICKDNVDCQVKYALKAGPKLTQQREKEKRADIFKRKESLKTKYDYNKIAQAAFNGYINARDKLRGRNCISCFAPLRHGVRSKGAKGGVDASHYRSRGAAPHLRFHMGNCHSSCVKCNRDLSGNIVQYRKGLILRYGVKYVEAIEADQRPRKYQIDDLKRIARIFRRRTRHYKKLLKQRENQAE